jgi:predicted transcriptional regulator
MFKTYLAEGSAKKISIDRELAKSLCKIARFRLKKAKSEKPDADNAFFIVENSYEAVRELIDALMALDGFKSYSHEACIDFLKDLYEKEIGISTILTIDRYRKIRNDIKYRGILPSLNEGVNALRDMEEAFLVLEKIIRKKLGKNL